MRFAAALAAFAGALVADGLDSGYRITNLQLQGPTEWRRSVDPVWVSEYPKLKLRYKATGLPAADTPVLTLRPGSVGPVTPGATNRENPFADGLPVVVLRALDLAGKYQVEVDLRGKFKTPQIDQLQFSLPAGATLAIEELEFRSLQPLPCNDGVAMIGLTELPFSGPLRCDKAAATTLRGREQIHISGQQRRGATLYLSMMAILAGGARETSETGQVLARIRYRGIEEEQFPLLVSERSHVLLNRKTGLYVLELDPARVLESVDLMDRSPHVQLLLFSVGLSRKPGPAADEELPPVVRAGRSGPPTFSAKPWFRAPDSLRAAFRAESNANRQTLSLSLTNNGTAPVETEVSFPYLEIRPAQDPQNVYYVFPRQGAVISRRDGAMQAEYSGAFPLQFLDVFAPRARRGAAVVVQDTEGVAKTFRLEKKGAAVTIDVRYRVHLAPGETWQAPSALIEDHGGDWHAGFAAYRRWLAAALPASRPQPAWLQSAFWCRRDYPIGGTDLLFDARANRYTFDKLERDGASIGGVDFIDISGWALSDTVGRVGDYPIELGGAANLRSNIEASRARGIPTGLYFEGFLIDKNSQVGRQHGAAWQMVDAKGQPRWWPGGSPEMFICPHLPAWRQFLAGRIAAVAQEIGAHAFYIDEHGFADPSKRCYAPNHGHPLGVSPLPGEIAMAREVRRALDSAGRRGAMLYLEEAPPDTLAPFYDAAFNYNMVRADRRLSPLKLSLFRFAFPDIRLWDMLTIGVQPRVLLLEDFRLSLWHGNGAWLKGRLETWYGEEILAFLKRARHLLGENAAAFAGQAEPMVESPDPVIFINRFQGGRQTVFTLFNASFRTRRLMFQGRSITLGPRDVDVVRLP